MRSAESGVRSAECGVRSAECRKCGVWKMWSVENAECRKCGVWKMRSVENAECGKCGVKKKINFQFQFPISVWKQIIVNAIIFSLKECSIIVNSQC